MQKTYNICLGCFEEILPEFCRIINADYIDGDFEKFEDSFADSGKDVDYFIVKGKSIELSIKLEKYEGYFFADMRGKGKDFQKDREYLYDCYIDSGGNPDAQEKQ